MKKSIITKTLALLLVLGAAFALTACGSGNSSGSGSGSRDVSFYLEKADRATTNYLFTANSSNFADVYSSFSK